MTAALCTWCTIGRHDSCAITDCTCTCNSELREHLEEPVTTIAEHRAHTDAPDHQREKRTRRMFTDDDKRRIVAELAAAPKGTRKVVLDRHHLSSSVALSWEKRYGNGREAPPESNGTSVHTPEPAVDAEPDTTEDADAFELSIVVDGHERDVLDALGFLEGHGDATGYVVHWLSALVADMADESDVKLVLTARRAHAAEAT